VKKFFSDFVHWEYHWQTGFIGGISRIFCQPARARAITQFERPILYIMVFLFDYGTDSPQKYSTTVIRCCQNTVNIYWLCCLPSQRVQNFSCRRMSSWHDTTVN